MSRSSLHCPWHDRTFAMVKARRQRPAGGNEQDCDCPLPRPAAGAVPRPELPLPVAGRPADLLGLRDGRRDPELVRAGLDRLGPVAGDLRLAAVPRHPDLAVLRHGRRSYRQSQPALPDAAGLHCGGSSPRRAVPARSSHAGFDLRARHPRRPGATLRHHHAQPAGRRDHAQGAADGGDGRVAHHRRFGARRRRPERGGPGRGAGVGVRLRRGLRRLHRQPAADPERRHPAAACAERERDVRRSRRCARASPMSGRRPTCAPRRCSPS